MTTNNKAWAIVHPIKGIIATANNHQDIMYLRDTTHNYFENKVVELGVQEKIRLTPNEWMAVKKALNDYYFFYNFLEEMQPDNILFDRFFNGSKEYRQEQQADFARLWASDKPEELVEIEKEKKYKLLFKATNRHQFLVEAGTKNAHIAYSKENKVQCYTQSEIDALGGDEKLAEWGVKKVEVKE